MSGDDFANVPRAVLRALLGPVPTRSRYDEDRGRIVEPAPSKLPWQPRVWPEDLEGVTFIYRHFAAVLAAQGRNSDAASATRRAVQAGVIRVVALSRSGELREVDPAHFRGELSPTLFWTAHEGPGSAPNLYVPASAGSGSTQTAEPAAARAVGMANAESACERWLAEEMRKSPHQRPKTRAAFQHEAMQRFPGLSERGFGRAWDLATRETEAEAWRKGGRPRAKPRT